VKAVLARGARFRFRARGESMTPFIGDGDTITVAPPGAVAPQLGDVVAFAHPVSGKLVVHRIVARRGAGYVIQGDNIPGLPDDVVPASAIVGRVLCVERRREA